MSDETWEGKVRERAQAIWQREGCPDNAAERHWAMAEAELQAEAAEPSATPSKKKASSAKPAKDPATAPKPKATRTKRQPAKSTS